MSPSYSQRVLLPHSEHKAVPHANHIGKAAAGREIRVSVILERRNPLDLDSLEGRHLSQSEYETNYGASPQDFNAVRTFAESNGLRVDEEKSSILRRRVELRGTIENFNKAFGVEMNDYESMHARHKGMRFHAFTGPVTVPDALVGAVQAVLGLDNRPIATPKMRFRPAASTQGGTFTPPQVAQAYNFPTAGNGAANGAGQTIGIIELGGGFTTTDITNYFQQLGLTAPNVTAVTLDGGSNAPGDPNGADGEVMLDIEVAGGVAPGANIVVYFTTNTDQGFQDAISTAIHDTAYNPSVLSISWGGPESTWAQTAINAMDTTCQSAAALGVTITVASGDSGSTDGQSSDTVDFPASSPNVLACGGTALTVTASGQYQSETVWNDQPSGGATGGGFSAVFAMPSYQTNAGITTPAGGTPMRGVPDVSGDASPETGYSILVDGQQGIIGGTSAVAPLWAGLVALLNQQLGRNVGYLNPQLYPFGETPFFDVTTGNNGTYSAAAGWDACTGLGSPNGQALLTAFGGPATAAAANKMYATSS